MSGEQFAVVKALFRTHMELILQHEYSDLPYLATLEAFEKAADRAELSLVQKKMEGGDVS